jgi:tetratricopeptide (TPR) repeat protein
VLKEFVEQILDAGFAGTTSGESLASIAQGIERLDRKVGRLIEITSAKPQGDRPVPKFDTIEMALKTPQLQFREALSHGQIDLALQVLPRVRQAAGYDEYIGALGIIVSMGDERAFALFESELDSMVNDQQNTKHDLIQIVILFLKNYFVNTGKGQEGLEYLNKVLERLVVKGSYSAELNAFTANQIGMLAWVIDDYESCLKYTQLAATLEPDEPAYYYNIALVYKATDATPQLEETLRKLATMPNLSEDHRRILEEFGFSK